MSLYHTKEWWRTQCGCEEMFFDRSLLIVPSFSSNDSQLIVVSSHNGYLRIYNPSSPWNSDTGRPMGYKCTDLIIEVKIADCIIDIKAGKFGSGSQEQRLSILTPDSLIVYAVLLIAGFTSKDDQCYLEKVYEHQLSYFPVALIPGSFGAVVGRDFCCIQNFDATLIFYEQEVHAFNRILAHNLLPGVITYIARNDTFIVFSSDWIVKCYRYQNIAENGKNIITSESSMSALFPDWTYNIGGPIIGIKSTELNSIDVAIVILSEQNLFCFYNHCANLKFKKKLEYIPLNFFIYVTEPEGELVILIISDTNSLLVYENTTLKWSAQLTFRPVAIARANIMQLPGAIILLSSSGHLEACYLGTSPSLFIAPSTHCRLLSSTENMQQLVKLRKKKKTSASDSAPSPIYPEIQTQTSLSSNQCGSANNDLSFSSISMSLCKILVTIISYEKLNNFQLCIRSLQAIQVQKYHHASKIIDDKSTIELIVRNATDRDILSFELLIIVSYQSNNGSYEVIQETVKLPLSIFFQQCVPGNIHRFIVKFQCYHSSTFFDKLSMDYRTNAEKSYNAIGLRSMSSKRELTINANKATKEYQIQADNVLVMTPFVQKMLNDHATLNSRLTRFILTSKYVSSIYTFIEVYLDIQKKLENKKNEMRLLNLQCRNITKRLLQGLQETNIHSKTGDIQVLISSTHKLMTRQFHEYQSTVEESTRASHNLCCALKLLAVLLGSTSHDDFKLKSAIEFEIELSYEVSLEKTMELNLNALFEEMAFHVRNKATKVCHHKLNQSRNWKKIERKMVDLIDLMTTPPSPSSTIDATVHFQ